MRFRAYDALRIFTVVANHMSVTSAADELNLTKGAVSYQIKRLEMLLGFEVFTRHANGITLTEKGKHLWHSAQTAFVGIEREIVNLRQLHNERITIGLSTYFASRWLSPRLMRFITQHPAIGLRLQPMADLGDFQSNRIDMAIRWGKGEWPGQETERLFHCPAKPTAGAESAKRIATLGIEAALPHETLLHDREDSQAWQDWHDAAGLPYRPKRNDLVIPDPNVRVQAVIDEQGLALNDVLVASELASGQLWQISTVELTDYGYYLFYAKEALANPALVAFRDWIKCEAKVEWPLI